MFSHVCTLSQSEVGLCFLYERSRIQFGSRFSGYVMSYSQLGISKSVPGVFAAMRYKKGSKVEVLNKQEVPSGSWRCAVIISGNGHTYSVRYDPCSSGMDELVERVSRKVVRPCPPLVQGPCSWMSGDVVEVFDNGSWKLAEVSSAVEGNHFLVRLLGSSNVFKVHKSDLRLRQCWQDNRWVVIRKDVKNSDNGKLLKGGCLWRVGCQQTGGFSKAQHCEVTTIVEEPKLVFFGGKKRGFQSCSPPPETFYKVTKKPKTGDAEGRCQKLSVDSEYRLQEKGQSWRLVMLAS